MTSPETNYVELAEEAIRRGKHDAVDVMHLLMVWLVLRNERETRWAARADMAAAICIQRSLR